jgi:uncharacterized membrane protein
MNPASIGRVFFGLSLCAFGILQFIYGDFVPGRAPAWPAGVPGRLGWAWVSGALLIAAGAAVISGKRARGPAVLTGAMIFLWALLRHIPELAANPHGVVLTNMGKAIALCGGALAVAGAFPADGSAWWHFQPRVGGTTDGLRWVGRVCLGAYMILAGVQHFVYTQFVASLVPAWIPGPLFWAYFAGVALLAGGAGLLLTKTARLAAVLSGVMIFLWVVLLHVPRALAAGPAQRRNEWTAVFEALAFSGIALVIAGSMQRQRGAPRLPARDAP